MYYFCMNENTPKTAFPHEKAWRFAADKHQGQLYPGTELPYLLHIGSVLLALLPALDGRDEYDAGLAVNCALLHDTVEDTNTPLDEIREQFGPAVAEGVAALSKNASLPKEAAMEDSLERIRRQPKEIWLVKLADRIANLGTPPPHWNREKCLAYAAEGRRILESLGEASPLLAHTLTSRIAAWEKDA